MEEQFQDLKNLYENLSRSINVFASANNIYCPKDCGICCKRPSEEIEVSAFEMAYLAKHLVKNGLGNEYLAKAAAAGDQGNCVLFNGRCAQYEYRPLTCRLFGFSSWRRKDGSLRYIPSATLRAHAPEAVEKAIILTAQSDSSREEVALPPQAALWRARLTSLDPSADENLSGLNAALLRALEAELWKQALISRETS